MSSHSNIVSVALVTALSLTGCGAEMVSGETGLEAIPASPFQNAMQTKTSKDGITLMGLRVVSLSPNGACLTLKADNKIYSPVFVVNERETVEFGNNKLIYHSREVVYDREYYAIGLVLSNRDKPELAPCPQRVAYLSDIDDLSSGAQH